MFFFCVPFRGALDFLGVVFLSSVALAAGGRHMVRKSSCFEAFFFGVSLFLLFLFCFGVCFAFFGRVRVQVLFWPLRFKTALKTQCFGYFFCLFCFFSCFLSFFVFFFCGPFRGALDFFGVVFLPVRRFGGRRPSYGAQTPLF